MHAETGCVNVPLVCNAAILYLEPLVRMRER